MTNNESFLEIIRARHFLTHNNKQITNVKSEYTIRCNKSEGTVDNIFLTFKDFLPNLQVIDSEGIEYPVMSNSDTKLLLEVKKDENSEEIEKLLTAISNHDIHLIWIKIPPNRKLEPYETRLIHINHERKKVEKKMNLIFLNTSANLSFPNFWIFQKPENYNITKQYTYIFKNDKLEQRTSWKKNKKIYYVNTPSSSTLLIKSQLNNLMICYAFAPKLSVIALPVASISLLFAFSIFLLSVQYFNMIDSESLSSYTKLLNYVIDSESLSSYTKLLDHKIEFTIFIISFSLITPRFISDIEIRHTYFWVYFAPILFILVFFFMGNI